MYWQILCAHIPCFTSLVIYCIRNFNKVVLVKHHDSYLPSHAFVGINHKMRN